MVQSATENKQIAKGGNPEPSADRGSAKPLTTVDISTPKLNPPDQVLEKQLKEQTERIDRAQKTAKSMCDTAHNELYTLRVENREGALGQIKRRGFSDWLVGATVGEGEYNKAREDQAELEFKQRAQHEEFVNDQVSDLEGKLARARIALSQRDYKRANELLGEVSKTNLSFDYKKGKEERDQAMQNVSQANQGRISTAENWETGLKITDGVATAAAIVSGVGAGAAIGKVFVKAGLSAGVSTALATGTTTMAVTTTHDVAAEGTKAIQQGEWTAESTERMIQKTKDNATTAVLTATGVGIAAKLGAAAGEGNALVGLIAKGSAGSVQSAGQEVKRELESGDGVHLEKVGGQAVLGLVAGAVGGTATNKGAIVEEAKNLLVAAGTATVGTSISGHDPRVHENRAALAEQVATAYLGAKLGQTMSRSSVVFSAEKSDGTRSSGAHSEPRSVEPARPGGSRAPVEDRLPAVPTGRAKEPGSGVATSNDPAKPPNSPSPSDVRHAELAMEHALKAKEAFLVKHPDASPEKLHALTSMAFSSNFNQRVNAAGGTPPVPSGGAKQELGPSAQPPPSAGKLEAPGGLAPKGEPKHVGQASGSAHPKPDSDPNALMAQQAMDHANAASAAYSAKHPTASPERLSRVRAEAFKDKVDELGNPSRALQKRYEQLVKETAEEHVAASTKRAEAHLNTVISSKDRRAQVYRSPEQIKKLKTDAYEIAYDKELRHAGLPPKYRPSRIEQRSIEKAEQASWKAFNQELDRGAISKGDPQITAGQAYKSTYTSSLKWEAHKEARRVADRWSELKLNEMSARGERVSEQQTKAVATQRTQVERMAYSRFLQGHDASQNKPVLGDTISVRPNLKGEDGQQLRKEFHDSYMAKQMGEATPGSGAASAPPVIAPPKRGASLQERADYRAKLAAQSAEEKQLKLNNTAEGRAERLALEKSTRDQDAANAQWPVGKN